ncbi:MAG: restriction endonuclease subunit S [Deltaproteobacteria bacterium]
MAVEWVQCALADACSAIDYGLTASGADHDVGPRFLRITDIVSEHIDWSKVPHVVADDETAAKYRLDDGDIVLARTGASTGASAYVKDPPTAVFASYLVRLKVKAGFDPRFLSYYLKSEGFWSFIRGVLGDKSAQPNASASTMTKAPLCAPRDKAEQRAIAHILGTLDDKIELNRRMSETLESMARALFKSWFVDFDPVRAKVEGRDTGLPKHIDSLFPVSFEESEFGEIPNGWSVGTLANYSSLNSEAWSKKTRPSVINYVDLSNTKWGRIEVITAHARQDAPSRAQRILRLQDTIVGTVRPGNGSYALISEDGLTGSTGFAVLRPLRIEYTEFVYLAATATETIDVLSHLADGGAYPAVRPEVVAATPVVLPSGDVLGKFSRLVKPLLAKIAGNDRESRTLAALRDALLPKLLSGEIRVGDYKKENMKVRIQS